MREVFSRAELLELQHNLEARAAECEQELRDHAAYGGYPDPEEEGCTESYTRGLREAADVLEEALNRPLWLPS